MYDVRLSPGDFDRFTQRQTELSDLADPGITRELRSIAGVAEARITGQPSNRPRITATSRAW